MANQRLVCQCGGPLRRPLPPTCPHCGAHIRGVRQRGGSRLLALLSVLAMFAVLVGFLWWMLGSS